jgi:hypothetical protein
LCAATHRALGGSHGARTGEVPVTFIKQRGKWMNAINIIFPYKHHGMWVFDDSRVGLVQEPFLLALII